ncbi:hypothetical protein [Natronoglycomyces albus]|uniref:Protein ImuA n=1 Tax=Natronoglycomyces albus TaxID=2811108 RepID=A0A895XRD6_9ACTN|nr:hypothetical protein [Natronoglycomyces albus]QSB06093.1 hypothetical protein JQS30_04015 [Natronoglycomyces albus]
MAKQQVDLASIPGLIPASQLAEPTFADFALTTPEATPSEENSSHLADYKAKVATSFSTRGTKRRLDLTTWPSLTPTRILPLASDIHSLFPREGLTTGTLVHPGTGATSLLWRILAEPSATHWCALVGLPRRHLGTAAEAGVNVEHLVSVTAPRPQVADAAAALMDGFAVVAVSTASVTTNQAARLATRARNLGAILLWWGSPQRQWPGLDTRLRITSARWSGLRRHADRQYGSGRIRSCELAVSALWRTGRSRQATLRLYTDEGGPGS